MKGLNYLVAVVMIGSTQAAEHGAYQLAQSYMALLGKQYGKERVVFADCEAEIDRLCGERLQIKANGKICVASRSVFKIRLHDAKEKGGIWRVTDIKYTPASGDTTQCKVTFRWWTEKNGVYDVMATLKTNNAGTCIHSVEEIATQIYTAEQIS